MTTDTLKSLSATLKFIDEWILMFPENYDARCEAYKTAMGQLFKNISVTNNNLLTQKQRYTKTIEDISGQWFIEKHAKGIPPLKRNTLGTKTQQKYDEIKSKLYDDNRWWNDWKFQLHWHMLEWVSPTSTKNQRKMPYYVSSTKTFKDKNIKTSHWVGHSELKGLYLLDFF